MGIDTRELAGLLQGVGGRPEPLERLLVESYCGSTDLRYELARYSGALDRFSSVFPDAKRVSIARAPAFINLMGAHTDYLGVQTLTMAIERDVVVYFSPRDDKRVNLVNANYWYPPRSFDIEKRIHRYSEGNWGNFAKFAAEAVRSVSGSIRGMDACVFGDIPSGVGLGSSTALMSALAMALAMANGLEIAPADIASMVAGRDGGGSAVLGDSGLCLASACGQAGCLLRVEPYSDSFECIPMPAGWSFVVCSSLVEGSDGDVRGDLMSRRMDECRLGIAMLAWEGVALSQLSDFPPDILGHLPEDSVSLREFSKCSKLSYAKLRDITEKRQEPREGFRIGPRVRHMVSEARRIVESEPMLRAGDMEGFGRLMNESHKSCSRDYEVSTPEIDVLASICIEEGAVGARLVGAGPGGYVAALVRDRDVAEFELGIISRYYHGYLQREGKSSSVGVVALENAIFPCKPCGGIRSLG